MSGHNYKWAATCDHCGVESGSQDSMRPCLRDGWQPIETAPLAKMVLLWARGWRQPFIGARNGDMGAVFLDGVCGEGMQMYGATHWMPLPAPPVEQGGQ